MRRTSSQPWKSSWQSKFLYNFFLYFLMDALEQLIDEFRQKLTGFRTFFYQQAEEKCPLAISRQEYEGKDALAAIECEYFSKKIRLRGDFSLADKLTGTIFFLDITKATTESLNELEKEVIDFYRLLVNDYKENKYSAISDELNKATDHLKTLALRLNPRGYFSEDLKTGVIRCWYDNECDYHSKWTGDYNPGYVVFSQQETKIHREDGDMQKKLEAELSIWCCGA
jgi:hypothetical protein